MIRSCYALFAVSSIAAIGQGLHMDSPTRMYSTSTMVFSARSGVTAYSKRGGPPVWKMDSSETTEDRRRFYPDLRIVGTADEAGCGEVAVCARVLGKISGRHGGWGYLSLEELLGVEAATGKTIWSTKAKVPEGEMKDTEPYPIGVFNGVIVLVAKPGMKVSLVDAFTGKSLDPDDRRVHSRLKTALQPENGGLHAIELSFNSANSGNPKPEDLYRIVRYDPGLSPPIELTRAVGLRGVPLVRHLSVLGSCQSRVLFGFNQTPSVGGQPMPHVIALNEQGELAWKYPTEADIKLSRDQQGLTSVALNESSGVLLATYMSALHGLDVKSGKVLWKAAIGLYGYSSSVVMRDKFLVVKSWMKSPTVDKWKHEGVSIDARTGKSTPITYLKEDYIYLSSDDAPFYMRYRSDVLNPLSIEQPPKQK